MIYEKEIEIAEKFKQNGFVFSVTVSPEKMMKCALSSEAETEIEICREIIREKYPTFKRHPQLIKSIEYKIDATCIIPDSYHERHIAQSRVVNVTLDPSMFEISVIDCTQNIHFTSDLLKAKALISESNDFYFLADFPSYELTSKFKTSDFVLIRRWTDFWTGSNALTNGFSLLLASDFKTYDKIFKLEAASLGKIKNLK